MKKILFILGLVAVGLVSCEMDHFRTDTMTSEQLKADPGAAVYTTDGVYAMFKDELSYKGQWSGGNTYVRHFFQMAEYRADNVVLSGESSDSFSGAFLYNDDGTMDKNMGYWWIAYKIIYGANSNIEALDENASAEAKHMKGENYFMRALAHFNLVNIFAKPISCGENNLGVVLRTSTDCAVTERATVGQVYAQVVEDLKEAARLMKDGKRRGNNGFIGYEAAMGLLSRVYLYMGENALVISTINEMLTGNPASKGDIASKLHDGKTYDKMFSDALTSKEVLWCVAHDIEDNKEKASIGGMYYSPNGTGGIGWGEHYYSDPLLMLFERYPEDLRHQAIFEHFGTLDDGKALVHWPSANAKGSWDLTAVRNVEKNADGKWAFKYGGKDYVVEQKDKNNDGYMESYIKGNPDDVSFPDADGEVMVHVGKNCGITGIRDSGSQYPLYMNKKFSNQGGNSNLCSPIMLRWGELVLNRAEAYAKTGADADALADINVIRERAGLPLWNDSHKWSEHGYKDLMDLILTERRMELCFEGHRAFDVWRNQGKMDRRFGGFHKAEIVDYTDDRIPFQIPEDEINASHIAQNPRQ